LFTAEFGGQVKVYDTKNFNLIDVFGKFNDEHRAWSLDVDFSHKSSFKNKVYMGD